jgi:hypothetical protein
MVKTKLKYVIPTFFTCFAQVFTARTEGSLLSGRATHDSLWHGTECESGVAPAQHGAIPHPI